jgi:Lrp/AsnC family transcriptional regulator for asnA, asnC and gidA
LAQLQPVEGIGDAANGRERELDEIDLQIISALQINGRANYADLATVIDLSPAAIRLRVNRLIDSGVVEIVAITDPLSIGFTVEALVGLTVDGDIEALSDEIGQRDYAVYVVLTAGRFDMLVEVLCRDNDHLLEVLNDLRGLEGVAAVEAHTYLKLTKQTYAWGMPPSRIRRTRRDGGTDGEARA